MNIYDVYDFKINKKNCNETIIPQYKINPLPGELLWFFVQKLAFEI